MKELKGKDLHLADVIFIDDRSKFNFIAKAIRYVQYGGHYPIDKFNPNHIITVVKENEDINKVMVIQSAFMGVTIKPLKNWVNHPYCNIIIKRYSKSFKGKKQKLVDWYFSKLGIGYDYFALLGIYMRYLLIKNSDSLIFKWYLNRIKNPLNNKIRFYCSEIIYKGFLKILKDHLWRKYHWTFITPLDMFKSKKLTTIAKHFNYKYK